MFTIIKRTEQTFNQGEEKIGQFNTFDEAHEFAQKEVCADIYHEGSKNKMYWFSDNNNASEPYKVRIEFNK